MPNRAIRKLQSENSKKTLEDGTPLVTQRRFPRTTEPKFAKDKQSQASVRRKSQITRGQLKKENGLV